MDNRDIVRHRLIYCEHILTTICRISMENYVNATTSRMAICIDCCYRYFYWSYLVEGQQMKSRQMYLGCIITRDDIYIDTWHNVASFQEFEKGYIVEHIIDNHIVVFVFAKENGYRIYEFWDTPDLMQKHIEETKFIESKIDETFEQITKELEENYAN
nr:MAG TPA: hypothetical protein [Caudoviricetes sp.]